MGELELGLLQKMYELAYTIRQFELRAIEQYRLGRIRGYFHPYLGEEGIATGAISALGPDDYIVSTHRGHGHAIAKGHDLNLMMAELFGKETGYCRGRGGSMHVADLAQHNLGANGIVGGGIPLAAGAALGVKLRGGRQVVLSFLGDGAANNGVFHESVNMAAIFKLPVVFILENNHFAVSTPVESSAAVPDLSVRARSYGIPGSTEDGNDAVTVHEALREPIARARNGDGPTFLEFKTYRHGGHHVNDPGLYMPQDRLRAWKLRDPVEILRAHLIARGLEDAHVATLNQRVDGRLDAAVRFAEESPEPSVEDFIRETEGG